AANRTRSEAPSAPAPGTGGLTGQCSHRKIFSRPWTLFTMPDHPSPRNRKSRSPLPLSCAIQSAVRGQEEIRGNRLPAEGVDPFDFQNPGVGGTETWGERHLDEAFFALAELQREGRPLGVGQAVALAVEVEDSPLLEAGSGGQGANLGLD